MATERLAVEAWGKQLPYGIKYIGVRYPRMKMNLPKKLAHAAFQHLQIFPDSVLVFIIHCDSSAV